MEDLIADWEKLKAELADEELRIKNEIAKIPPRCGGCDERINDCKCVVGSLK